MEKAVGYAVIGMATTSAAAPFFVLESLQSESYRAFRVALFVASIACYMVPLMNSLNTYMLWAFAFEGVAGLFYITKIPERCIRGENGRSKRLIDTLCSSHIIWHYLNFPFDILMLKYCYEAYLKNYS